MTDPIEGTISEEQAAAIWRRAARMQMEAAHRLEERSRSLEIGVEHGVTRAGKLRQEDVETAAMEAGISPEYVRLAQAELSLAAESADVLQDWENRLASRMLRMPQRSIELSRVVAAPPHDVLAAMQRVFPAYPYHLSLRDSVGGDPTSGGVLVFALPEYSMSTTSAPMLALNAAAVDLKQVLVRLIPAADERSTEVVLTGDMHFGVRRNWRVGAVLSGTGGLLGGGVGVAIAVKALALTGGLLALPLAAGAVAAGAFGAWGFGAAFQHYLRKLTRNLEEMLQTVDVNARTAGAFATPDPKNRIADPAGNPRTGA